MLTVGIEIERDSLEGFRGIHEIQVQEDKATDSNMNASLAHRSARGGSSTATPATAALYSGARQRRRRLIKLRLLPMFKASMLVAPILQMSEHDGD